MASTPDRLDAREQAAARFARLEWLRTAELKVSKSEFCKRAGIPYDTYMRWKMGRPPYSAGPCVASCRQIARMLRISEDWLFDDIGELYTGTLPQTDKGLAAGRREAIAARLRQDGRFSEQAIQEHLPDGLELERQTAGLVSATIAAKLLKKRQDQVRERTKDLFRFVLSSEVHPEAKAEALVGIRQLEGMAHDFTSTRPGFAGDKPHYLGAFTFTGCFIFPKLGAILKPRQTAPSSQPPLTAETTETIRLAWRTLLQSLADSAA